jgi:hypothetical protein
MGSEGFMTPTNVSEIHNQCERLVYRFLQLLESQQGKTADLFTEDGQAFEDVGREKIREHFSEIEDVDNNVNVLVSSNLLIDVEDEDHAAATSYVTHYVADPLSPALHDPSGAPVGGELATPRTITRWSWQFRRVDGEWLVSKIESPEPVLFRKDVLDMLES